MQYDYNEGEVYDCPECGLLVEIIKTAVPVQELSCCGVEMVPKDDVEAKVDEESDPSDEYQAGDEYFCPVCGLEAKILSSGNPSMPFSCCGVPMELK